MYVRAQTHRRKNGTTRQGFSLAETVRVNGQPRSKTLLNLGPDFDLPKERWNEFARHIEARLKAEPCLPFEDEAFEKKVADTVQQLRDKGYDITKKTKKLHLIDPTQTTHSDSRTFAGERASLHAMEQLKLPDILVDVGLSERHAKLACALITGRMLSPGSERHTHDWMAHTSGILPLLGLDLPGERTLYRCAEALYPHRQQIMDRLFGKTRELLDFEETIIFYDLTNTFYHGKKKGELLRHGYSKEKRRDCPLVSLALTLDASGFPRSAEVLPGNASEPATLAQAIEKLNGSTPTIIMDAGIATKKNLAYLKAEGLDWVCVDRGKVPEVPASDPDQELETASKVAISAWRLPVPEESPEESLQDEESPEESLQDEESPEESPQDEESPEESPQDEESPEESPQDEEQFIYVHSEAKQAKEDEILATKCTEFEEELTKLHEGLSKPYFLKTYALVERKVGRLKNEYDPVSHLYDITVTPKQKSKHAEAVTFTKRDAHEARMQASGGYVIRTSHIDWSIQKTLQMYWRLTEIESVFRAMKTDLGLRPIYHSKDVQIASHLFITVLAYYVAYLIRCQLKKDGVHANWNTIRTHLNRIHRITTKMHKNRYRYLVTKVDQDLPPFVRQLFKSVGLVYDPNATRIVEEHVGEPNPPEASKPIAATPKIPPDS